MPLAHHQHFKAPQQHTDLAAQLAASLCPWRNPGYHQACGAPEEACWPQSAAADAARACLSGCAPEFQPGGHHRGGCCRGDCSAAGGSGTAGCCTGGCHARAPCHLDHVLCHVLELPSH